MKKLLTLLFMVGLVTMYGQMDVAVNEGYGIGDKATDFSLKNIDGEMVSMKGTFPDAEGYVVIFTCNHCPYAKMYEDRIIALSSEYASQGYPVIAINPNDPEVVPEDGENEMAVRAEEKGFNFPYLFDAGQTVFPQYGALKTPHVYLLDSDLTVKYIGAIDDNPRDEANVGEHYLKNAIEAMKMDKMPDPATTKAVGCRIKVKS